MDTIELAHGVHDQAGVVAARAVQSARASAARVDLPELFGSFVLSGAEFAIAAASIREVVRFPDKLTPIPLSPVYLEGVFTLRGQVIPVVNLARIFDPAAPAAALEHKIAIIDHDEIQLGIVFHDTGEILRVHPEQRSTLHYREGQKPGVIAGTITLDGGARLLEILDARALVSIENLPQVRAVRASQVTERRHFQLQAERRKCVSFRAGATALALDMGAIREIINVPAFLPSALQSPLCKGRINFRGSVIGVIDMAALLHCTCTDAALRPEQRILVAQIGDTMVGLLVDAIDDIFAFYPSDVLAIPLLSAARKTMFAGCISRPGHADVLMLDQQGIFSNDELRELSAGHSRLYPDTDGKPAAAAAAPVARQKYIVFGLENAWAMEISQIREIVDYNLPTITPPGMPGFVHGLLNLRQQMVTVIDLRALYHLPPLAERSTCKVLIIENADQRFGLIVDAVENIITVPATARRTSPKLVRCQLSDDVRSEVEELIDYTAPGAAPTTLSVFDQKLFMARIARDMAILAPEGRVPCP
jgi:purine-binding chemotaxis protein CheW